MTRTNKKIIIYVLAIILAVIQLLFSKNNFLPTSNQNVQTPNLGVSTIPNTKQTALVTHVIDGDTIEIEGKIKVRYIGVNSPEIDQCFAEESYMENKKLVEGKTVSLVKDISDKDKYGRLLRYVYVGDQFVNEYLITNGYAKIMVIKPDIKYYQKFKSLEKQAKENNLGMWNKCN